uniref:Uncharacterized protein TCIL3000_5_4180 n=1 Tax=Trypanosoma congolense (strain IL3000) TaxID=1068625 RepID=G0UM09_TRYCI|nr:unnamed protein product [Trypanosoma congolense IL3000]
MPKRCRSVLHGYVISHAESAIRDGNAVMRVVGERRPPPPPASDTSVEIAAAGTCRSGEEKAAAFRFYAGAPKEHCGLLDDSPRYPQGWPCGHRSDPEMRDGIVCGLSPVEMSSLTSPLPSYRAVQQQPNWLERAVMRARCSDNHTGLGSSRGHRGRGCALSIPDPACLYLGPGSDKERSRALAVAAIAADFYATRRRVGHKP